MPSATRRIQPVGQSPHSNGVASPFLIELLSLQCRCGGAERAVVIQPDGTGSVRVLASYPYSGDGHETPEWFQNCVELGHRAFRENTGFVTPIEDHGQTHAISLLLETSTFGRVVETFLVKTANEAALESTRRLLRRRFFSSGNRFKLI